jgi:carbon storage regulator
MLILSRKLNESIMIGDQIEISIVDMKGDQVKLGIAAPKNVKVYRKEVYVAIQEENIEATKARPDVIQTLGNLFNEQKENEEKEKK